MNTTINGVEFAACLCGCTLPTSGKSNYRPGHDARHAGQVARAAVAEYRHGQETGTTVDWLSEIKTSALSPALRVKAERIALNMIEKKAPKARTAAAPKATGKKIDATTPVESIKIGRWTYPARLVKGKLERNTKRDGSGEWVAA